MKTHITISVDVRPLQAAQDFGLNISKICNDAIKAAIPKYNQQTKLNCTHKWLNPVMSAGGLAKQCEKCGKVKFIKIGQE